MFPALRQNGLARWLAVVLALFGLMAGLLLCLALSAGAARGRALGLRPDRPDARAEVSRSTESLHTAGALAPRSPAK